MKYLLLSVAVMSITACDIQTTVVKPDSFYDMSLSQAVRNKADLYKEYYIDNKLEDEEVDGEMSERDQRAHLAADFEQAINALYIGNVREEKNLRHVLDLVEFSTAIFKENTFSDQLSLRSAAISDFMIDYQINAALSSKENQMWDAQIEKQGAIMAEQQSDYVMLKLRYDQLKQSQDKLRERLAQAEKQLEERALNDSSAEEAPSEPRATQIF